MNNTVSIIVLTCDKYSDLWDDFFTLKEKYWPNCSFDSYLITEEKDYKRSGVTAIRCGRNLEWGERFRIAVESINSRYFILFLDDYYICKGIDDELINDCLAFMEKEKVSYYRMGDTFGSLKRIKHPEYVQQHRMIIPKNQKYGVSTSEAIWERDYLLDKLSNGKVSAWQFELDRCEEASSERGMTGLLIYDDRKPLNVTEVPVVIQGKYYPRAIRYFKTQGYEINIGNRALMTRKEVLRYDIVDKIYRVRFARAFIKGIGRAFGFKFVS